MNTPTIFKEYIWLVNTIRKAGRITFSEIQEKWLANDIKAMHAGAVKIYK